MKQMRQEGIETLPGQTIRYIITDHKSRSYQKRVIVPELADENTMYDRAKYYEYQMQDYQDMNSKRHLFMKFRRLQKITPTCNVTVTKIS